MRYLNRLLDPIAQSGFAQSMGYLPTVTDAVLPDDLRKELDFTAEERAHFVRQDLQYLDQNSSAFKDWWDKEFKA